MCHHTHAHLVDSHYFCDHCNDKIPSKRLTQKEQDEIRSDANKIDAWENAPMVET